MENKMMKLKQNYIILINSIIVSFAIVLSFWQRYLLLKHPDYPKLDSAFTVFYCYHLPFFTVCLVILTILLSIVLYLMYKLILFKNKPKIDMITFINIAFLILFIIFRGNLLWMVDKYTISQLIR